MSLAPPSSQKADARPISFLLNGGGPPSSVDLVIRPEDLSRSDPSRMAVQQTLGGAWADSFGPGIAQIQISGHTGWRRTAGDESADGLARFQRLKDSVFDQWHARRERAVAAGQDPDTIQLVFSDALDDFAVVVAPMSFTLRRSRSRPLLCQYQLNLTVLQASVGRSVRGPLSALGALADVTQSLGLDSLTDSVNRITALINDVQNFVNRTIAAPVRAFMEQTARLYSSVRGLVSAIDGVAASVINIAQMTARAGLNLFRTLAAVAQIPSQVRQRLMQVAGAYSNIFCVLRNALRRRVFVPDYSPLFGASNCSSTSGGRPVSQLSGQNPFFAVVATGGPVPVTVAGGAQNGLRTLANSDPVLRPLSLSSIGTAVRSVVDGLSVAL